MLALGEGETGIDNGKFSVQATQETSKDGYYLPLQTNVIEFRVFFALGLVFSISAVILYALVKFAREERKRYMLPLLALIGFSSADEIYRKWAQMEAFYGIRPLEFALTRTIIMAGAARIMDSDYASLLSGKNMNQDKIKGSKGPPGITVTAMWCFWFPLIGLMWGLEESFLALPESFIGLVIACLFLLIRYGIGSRLGIVGVPITVAGVLMAKSGAVTGASALNGILHICRILSVEFLVRRTGTVSPITLIWGPGIFATFTTLIGYLIFEYGRPYPVMGGRGVLDYLSAAGFGALFSFGAILAVYETMKSASILTLQATTCIVEILVLCVLVPIATLPVTYRVILPLNIPGFILCLAGALLIIKTDTYSGTNLSHTLFRFLDEEEELASMGPGDGYDIEEDEWLLSSTSSTV